MPTQNEQFAEATASAASGLINLLDETHPVRPPDPRDSDREIWMKAGERRLIDHLKTLAEAAGHRRLP